MPKPKTTKTLTFTVTVTVALDEKPRDVAASIRHALDCSHRLIAPARVVPVKKMEGGE